MDEQKCVLIVSNDPDLLQTLTFALVFEKFSVNSATSWDQAVSICSRTPPAVIIHDVRNIEGMLRTRLWEFRNAYPKIPVMLLSSLDSPELSEAEEAGLISASLVKPPRLEAIEECLARLGATRIPPREAPSPAQSPAPQAFPAAGLPVRLCLNT